MPPTASLGLDGARAGTGSSSSFISSGGNGGGGGGGGVGVPIDHAVFEVEQYL
jgi:hypothetical protein